MRLRDDAVIANLVQVSNRSFAKALGRLRRPTDRAERWASPASIDTGYSTGSNALVVPAGALQPPEFDANGPLAANYAGIGTKIGHEMGHGFDNLGRQYDADGNLRNWWTDADRREYSRRAEQLVQQYDRYEPMAGHHVNGRNTLPENLADLTGLELGYDGLALARKAQGVAFSKRDQQLYFQSWAKLWRVQYTEPLLVRIVNSDMHAPLQYRCMGPLANFQPFYDVMHPPPSDPEYLAPAQRVTIW